MDNSVYVILSEAKNLSRKQYPHGILLEILRFAQNDMGNCYPDFETALNCKG